MSVFAWWNDPDSNYEMSQRSWLRFYGYSWTVKLHDRFVQGERLQTLIEELEAKIQEELAGLPVMITGGKWQGTVDQEATNARRRIVDNFKRELELMKADGWGPKYTFKCGADGLIDESTIEAFVPSKEQLRR